MTKSISIALLSLSALLLSGCKGEEEAREYAKGLMEVLKTYQAQLEQKTGAEQKAYRSLARIYSEGADNDLLASLNTDRKERGDRLADLAIAGRTPAGAALQDLLKDYAVHETDATHELLTRESDNYDKYLSSLNKLSIDEDAVEQATGALEVLTRKPSLLDELKFLKSYGTAAKSCLDELTCKDLADELKAAQFEQTAPAKVLPDAKKEKERQDALTARVAAIQARQKRVGCDQKPTCPKDQKQKR